LIKKLHKLQKLLTAYSHLVQENNQHLSVFHGFLFSSCKIIRLQLHHIEGNLFAYFRIEGRLELSYCFISHDGLYYQDMQQLLIFNLNSFETNRLVLLMRVLLHNLNRIVLSISEFCGTIQIHHLEDVR
jgi:hypothetical protein